MANKISTVASVSLTIADVDLGNLCLELEWSSFLNTGYIVKGKVHDANHFNLKAIVRGSGEEAKLEYLKDGRRKPVPIKFKFSWNGGDDDNETEERIAYLTSLNGTGSGQNSFIEFIAIDPPSFLLNAGTADGRVYQGCVSDVIKKVVEDFTGNTDEVPNLEVDVTKTNDSTKNLWYMARQDPKTFIMGLLDFSSSFSSDKSRWIVSSNDKKINIKKESDLEGIDFGVFNVASNTLETRDVLDWELNMNNFVSAYQARLITGGISAVSGQYLDVKNAEENVVVRDENTAQKRNVDLKSDRAFAKPGRSDTWPQGLPATFIMAMPEYNARDVGMNYADFIDGRARQKFINMLSLTMRIRIDIYGNKKASSSDLLGVSTAALVWKDIGEEDELYFLHGNWIVYGFRHVYLAKRANWMTSLYLHRIDYDATAKKLNVPPATDD